MPGSRPAPVGRLLRAGEDEPEVQVLLGQRVTQSEVDLMKDRKPNKAPKYWLGTLLLTITGVIAGEMFRGDIAAATKVVGVSLATYLITYFVIARR